MYTYTDKEIVEGLTEHFTGSRKWPWFWFRDVCLEAERRGIVVINRAPGENLPFWWDMKQVEITAKGKAFLEVHNQRQG